MSQYKKYIIIIAIIIVTISLFGYYILSNQDTDIADTKETTSSNLSFTEVDNSSELIMDYAFKDDIFFKYPEGWSLSTTGQKSGVFSNDIASVVGASSDYQTNGRKTRISISTQNIQDYPFRDVGNIPPENKAQIGSKVLYTNNGFLNEFIQAPNGTNSTEWADQGLNKMYSINYQWMEEGIDNYYFEANCSGGADDKENIIEACTAMIDNFSV